MLRNLHRLLLIRRQQQNAALYKYTASSRWATTAATTVAAEPRKYTDTINLPRTKFPQRLTATKRADVERHINESCFAPLYDWQRNHLPASPQFCLHDGPPYANGDLHMGHAINKILKDIILRQHVIAGQRVHYHPGWDCHGLPIELKAVQSGTTASAPLAIRAIARRFAAATVRNQLAAFRSWGVMADWQRPDRSYRTMDASYVRNQWRLFQRLLDDRLVYRDVKPVYWSPSSRTALAEAELEYDPAFQSPSLMLRLRVAEDGASLPGVDKLKVRRLFALIWTTTPWSLPANQALCVNESLEYSVVQLEGHDPHDAYIIATELLAQFPVAIAATLQTITGKELLAARYHHPLNAAEILPILPAAHVQASKGTGLVHTAPAHGPDDYLVSIAHQLPAVRCLVDESGEYTEEAPAFLRGRSVLDDGNRLVLDALAEDVVHLGEIRHSYPLDWRTKKPVLLRASQQWFINTERLKELAIEQLDGVAVFPQRAAAANMANLVAQLRRRPYWCISRQRAWGTAIPVFYVRKTGETIADKRIVEHLCRLLEAAGGEEAEAADLWWSAPVEQLIPAAVLADWKLTAAEIRRGDDILDIWFDSGISWSYAVPEDASGRRVADLYCEGHDQFTGWFQAALMTSVARQKAAPYRALFVHGFAVDERGAKMSKSLGNVVEPGGVVARYGVDVLRWWVAHHGAAHASVPVGKGTLDGAAECVQKCRATLRYLVGSCGVVVEGGGATDSVDSRSLHAVDRHFMQSLRSFESQIRQLYTTHQYNRAVAAILHFITNDVSADYLHTIKDRLYCGTSEQQAALQLVLRCGLGALLRALWPITPFLVEECWSHSGAGQPFYKSVDSQLLRQPEVAAEDESLTELMALAAQLKQQLNQSVRDRNPWTLHATIAAEPTVLGRLQPLQPELGQPLADSQLCELLQVGGVTLQPDETMATVAAAEAARFAISVESMEGVLCARCRRFAVPEVAGVCARCTSVLGEKV